MYAIKRSLVAALTLPLLLALPACGKKDEGKKDEAGDAKKEDEKKVEKKELSTLFTGDKVSIPGPYGGIAPGMTKDEAKKALPDLPDDGNLKPEEYEGIWFNVDFNDANDDDTIEGTDTVSRLYFNAPKDEAVKLMTAKWGEPKKGEDLGKEVLWWFNPEAELRVSLADSFTDGEAHIEFTHYWPVAKFMGAEGKEIAFEKDAPLLGLTVADLEAKYGPYVKKESAEEAAKNQEQIKKLAGEEAGALMGKPTASIDLEYPPLEWGKYWTPVHFMWTDDGKIRRVWFSLEFEPHPPAKDEIMALLKAKWGEPKEEEEYGDKVYVFSEEPFIKVEEDTITKAWGIYIEPNRG